MAEAQNRLTIGDLRGGRNGTDPPLALKQETQRYQGGPMTGSAECVDAINVDWYNATFARKRNGANSLSTTFASGGPFISTISFLGRHVPGTDEGAAELWAADNGTPAPGFASPVFGRLGPSTPQWSPVSLVDAVTGNTWDITSASIHGKFFLSYASAVNRLHCWDPVAAKIRRAGLAAPVLAPTVADTGGGTYAAVARFYRVRFTVQAGGFTILKSEPSPSVSFTPSGAGTAARITKPATVSEDETHWELEASTDGVTFFLLATTVVGTTTFDDSAATTTYQSGTVSAVTGTYTLQKSYKFIAVDQNRILGFGSHTSTDPQNRIEFSAISGSTTPAAADEERVPLANFVVLDEADSGVPTGLVGPINGAYYAFKYRQVWKLIPTGVASQPYNVFPISKVIGAIGPKAIAVAEDREGNPSIYFMAVRGAYRLGTAGLEYIGKPNEDIWLGTPATVALGQQVNLSAARVVSHGVYYNDLRQVWFWYAAGTNDDPTVKLAYDVMGGGWARHTSESAAARCSVMFSDVVGAAPGTAMGRALKPYIGNTSATGRILRCDATGVLTDNGTTFAASVTTKPYTLGGIGQYFTVNQGTVVVTASSVITPYSLFIRLIRDLGAETSPASNSISTVTTSDTGLETRIQKLFDVGAATCWAVQVFIGDTSPIANAWQIDAVTLNYTKNSAIA